MSDCINSLSPPLPCQTPPLHPKQSKPTPSSNTDAHKKEEELTPEERARLEEEVAKQVSEGAGQRYYISTCPYLHMAEV